jgi:hypothetical protein
LFKLPESQFITALNALDGEKLSYAVQVHLYNLATICRRKYSAFGKAIRNAEFAFAIVAAGEITRALI